MPSATPIRGLGGQTVFASEHVQRDLRDFNEVRGASLSKDHAQLARGVAQQREAGADDLPLFFGVAGGRQIADGGEQRTRGRERLRGSQSDRANRAFPTLHSVGNPCRLSTLLRNAIFR